MPNNDTLLARRVFPQYLFNGGIPVTIHLDPVTHAVFREIVSVDGWTVEEGIERFVGTMADRWEKRHA